MQGKGKGGKQGLGRGVGWVGSLGCAVGRVAYIHMWGAHVERGAEREQVRGLQYRVGALISSPSQK